MESKKIEAKVPLEKLASNSKNVKSSASSIYLGRLSALSRLLYTEFSTQKKICEEIHLLALGILLSLEKQGGEQYAEQGQLWFRLSEIRETLLAAGCDDVEKLDTFCHLPNFIALLEQSGFYFFSDFCDGLSTTESNSAYFWILHEETHEKAHEETQEQKQEPCFSLARFGSLQLKVWQYLNRRIAKKDTKNSTEYEGQAKSDSRQNITHGSTHSSVHGSAHGFWDKTLLLRALESFHDLKKPLTSRESLQECLEKLCASRLLLIVGGPGSGKTTLLASLLGVLREAERFWGERNLEFALSAPTARAAQRMLESLHTSIAENMDIEAQTLHKLLSIGWSRAKLYRAVSPSARSKSKVRNLAKLDLLVIDEASMVDNEMALELLSSMHPNTRLILIGDPNQLPAVGLGAFWQDLLSGISHKHLAQNLVNLEGSHRFIGEIKALAEDVLHGKRESFLEKIRAGQKERQSIDLGIEDSKLISWQKEDGGNWASYLWQHWLLKGFPKELLREQHLADRRQLEKIAPLFQWMREYTILSPLQKSRWGAKYINQTLLAGQQAGRRTFGEKGFFHACPLQITKNNYELRLYNGDRGFCLEIGSQFYGVFEGEEASYRFFPMSQLSDCEASFVQSIHKSQGSEYQNVCIVLPEFDAEQNIWSRALLYTAVTRAKNRLHFLGREAGLHSVAETLTTESSRKAPSLLTQLLRSA